MSHAPFIVAGYGITLASIGTYAWWVVRRGRQLSRQVPSDRRRFLG